MKNIRLLALCLIALSGCGADRRVLSADRSAPASLLSDGVFLYWTESFSIKKMPVEGGIPTQIAGGVAPQSPLALHDRKLYFEGTGSVAQPGISEVDIDTGHVRILVGDPEKAGTVYGIAADAAAVFWTTDSEVRSVAIEGGSPTSLARNQRYPMSIATDPTFVYWHSQQGLQRVERIGGTPQVLVPGQDGPIQIVSDGIYWVNHAGTVERVGFSGELESVVSQGGAERGRALVIDEIGIYWATTTHVFRTVRTGGEAIEVARDQQNPTAVATDNVDLFWNQNISRDADRSEAGSIMRVPKR